MQIHTRNNATTTEILQRHDLRPSVLMTLIQQHNSIAITNSNNNHQQQCYKTHDSNWIMPNLWCKVFFNRNSLCTQQHL
eukprot:5395-Heterococcus_DN1.PRE.3